MTSIEVPRGEWGAFLNGFAAAHRDSYVNVEVAEEAVGDRDGLRQMPAHDIGLREDRTSHASVTVQTEAGDGPASYTVHDANCVRVMKREDGVDDALFIGNEQGAQLLLHFVFPRPLDAGDGALG